LSESASDITARVVGLVFLVAVVLLFQNWRENWSFVRKRFSALKLKNKQLIVLITIGVWYTIAFIYVTSEYANVRFSFVASEAFFCTTPAIVFGGIAIWWLGQAKKD
jgi:hypothetical protein